jgi:hypothetical protein
LVEAVYLIPKTRQLRDRLIVEFAQPVVRIFRTSASSGMGSIGAAKAVVVVGWEAIRDGGFPNTIFGVVYFILLSQVSTSAFAFSAANP